MGLNITGGEAGKLSAAIANAYPDSVALQRVLDEKLNDNMADYAGLHTDYRQTRFVLIKHYNARHRIDRLVLALIEDNPDNAELLRFAWRHEILKRPAGSTGTRSIDDNSLERMLDPARGFTDVGAMLKRLGQIVNSVCRIAVPVAGGTGYGTGFLIGDQTVLTNWHVVEQVSAANRNAVTLQFDYRTGPDGQTLSAGVPYRLADDWLLDSSPFHDDDLTVGTVADNLAAQRPEDRLDYAVLRLAGEPGKDGVGEKPSSSGQPRGHLRLQEIGTDPADFATGQAALFIFQHPYEHGQILPLQLDWNKPAILGTNANGTRVLYDVNTRCGSSGSPCFNARLQLIALHHAGGLDWPAAKGFLYNRGIPLTKVRALMESRGKLALVR